jgi:hypothetical protein
MSQNLHQAAEATGDPRGAVGGEPEVAARLRATAAKLPPTLGGAPARPLMSVGPPGSSSRPSAAPWRRDEGCVFPGCDRPLAWCDAHHLWHWVDGGPTDRANLALLCRAHHRAVHEGGWRLIRGPDGRFTATPGKRTLRPNRHRHPQPPDLAHPGGRMGPIAP